ncbi:MAG: endopeptidase La [Myxococcota bacterium]
MNHHPEVPKDLPSTLPVLPLRQGFLLPGVASPFAIARPASLAAVEAAKRDHDGWILVAIQRTPESEFSPHDLLPVGVLARILHPVQRTDQVKALAIQGVQRVEWSSFSQGDHLRADYRLVDEAWPEGPEAEALRRSLVESVESLFSRLEVKSPIRVATRNAPSPVVLVDVLAAFVESGLDWKHEVLTTLKPLERARMVLRRAAELGEVLDAQKSIADRVRQDIGEQERKHILRRQLEAIQDELGEGSDEQSELAERLAALDLPEEVRASVDKELKRLERIQPGSPERNVAIDWLDWVAELPWGRMAGVDVDIGTVEARLDESHHGLNEVKKQVVQNLAVRKLAGSGRADVLLLVGPPGVGKTSIAEAIAETTGRELVRVALGGVRDEAELRGHRRTYVGARPGRIVEGLRRAGASDPVLLLDEVDKLGRGWQGDPASALLEILDPEQNHAFTDHYMEVPFDLSKVLFIATANDLSGVPSPLLDRMEVVSIEGYTEDEKLAIARSHVLPKLAKNAGVEEGDVFFSDAALRAAISGWTREAGVRQLQRTLGKVYRAAAVAKAKGELEHPWSLDEDDLAAHLGRRRNREERHEAPTQPGVATGLAWTPMGGDVLYVEASDYPGSGQLVLTGQLGDVMKESAQAAFTYARVHAEDLGVPTEQLRDRDVHVHVPAGATPKDGPSAGVTMYTALASLLTGRNVKSQVAMTGEVSLRGRVLPVGGIKSKVLAAHARGLRTVLLPKQNEPDVDDIPKKVLEELEVVFVDDMSEVLDRALDPVPGWTPTFPRPQTLA